MNLESINKWLDEEYGVTYTDLKELHNSLKDENMILQERIDKAINYIEKTDTFQIIHSTDELAEMLREKTIKDLLNILKGDNK